MLFDFKINTSRNLPSISAGQKSIHLAYGQTAYRIVGPENGPLVIESNFYLRLKTN